MRTMRKGRVGAVARAFAVAAGLVFAVFAGPWALAAPAQSDADAASPRDAADAGAADTGTTDARAADASLDETVAAQRKELLALLAFRDGRKGPLRSAELFRIDVSNNDAVAKRLPELRKDLDAARAQSASAAKAAATAMAALYAGDAGADADAGEPDREGRWLLEAPPSEPIARLLRVRVLEARLQIFSLAKPRRDALLAAEQESLRAEAARAVREQSEREAERAEEARLRALQAAQEARGKVERQLAEVRASLEATRGEQLRARAELAERRQKDAESYATREELLAQAADEVSTVPIASAEADALYDTTVQRLIQLRNHSASLLAALEHDQPMPRPEAAPPFPESEGPPGAREQDELKKLRELRRELEKEATDLEADDRDETWTALGSAMRTERRLNELRIALLERVSPAKHRRVLGFGPEGRAQGLREIERIELELRWLRASGGKVFDEALAELRQASSIARISLQLVGLLVLLGITVTARRRLGAWLRALRDLAARSVRRPALLRLIKRVADALDAVGREAIALGGVLLLPTVTRVDVHTGAWSVAYTLLLWYGIYRLVIAVTHRSLEWAVTRGGAVIKPSTGQKILRSVRVVVRAAFFFAALLAASAAVVGRGYLHAMVVRAAWILSIPIAAVLVSRWRADIAEAYLRVRPTGALSGLVARTRDRWAGFFVAIAAFVVLLGAGIVNALNRFVLGFEHSRKALAYLFRRRLEKKIEHAPAEETLLEPETLAFFTERPPEDDALVLDRFPGLVPFEARFREWQKGARIGATLLVGKTGYGKTSWLNAARQRCNGAKVVALCLRERATTERDVVAALARATGAPSEVHDVAALAEHLRGQGPQVITVDDAQLWFLRGVGKLAGWRAFTLVMDRTSNVVLWVVAFAHYPWEFLSWISRGDTVFRSIVHLMPWTEAEIGQLLERRNKASGLTILYDDLLVEDQLGLDSGAQILTTARDYNRLVWDYAEGSPRVALHVWGRSLVPDGPTRARVRLFMNPNAAFLESLSESARFVLAAVTWHERLSVQEAVSVLLLPPLACEDAFKRFIEQGVAELDEGSLRITPRWWPLVVRYLRRKHLIDT
ncbi:AAA family ATPase [Pendulispora albinea]|uniref:ORC1/DEAH AAA+ ATPase domain-containing protein n=1 Tax=Pendulispora albinea TaxID=2741071 RepID=A0ABZ2LVE1_9BACT